ncbi:MAG: aldo/keto reductase [Candidatus Latescibacterota bacterium]|nr:aldo/keto reductase [Candidatus Latescibacterota bacterium]
MKYRRFGQTGLDVSAIGFGCWEFGGSYGHFDDTEVVLAIHKALDLGINCFDTAQGYGFGNSEKLLAKGLGDHRKDIILVTKWGVGYNDTLSEKSRDSRTARCKLSIETSLKHLGSDYVDVYLIHWPDRRIPFDEPMRAMEDIVKEGKARFVGVSNFKPEEIESCMDTRRVDVGQYGYHMFDRRTEVNVLPTHKKHGMGFMGYGSLAHGLLAGAFDENTKFEDSDWRSKGGLFNMLLFTEENFPRNLKVVEDLKGIADDMGVKMANLALAWVLANPVLSVALVGARSLGEVEDNVAALDVEFDTDALQAIDAVFARYGVDTKPDVWVE